MDWPKLSLDWLKLKPRYLFGVAITCLVVVALPKGWRQYLGYDGFVEPYRGWISLGALVFSVYGFVMFMANVPSKILEKWETWRFKRNAPGILRQLSSQEKGYIAKYIAENASTLQFRIDDGVINGLIAKSIVYRSSSVGSYYSFAFNL